MGARGGLLKLKRGTRRRLIALVLVLLVASSCSSNDEPPTEQPLIGITQTELDAGEVQRCLLVGPEVSAEVTEALPFTACDAPHTHEIFAIIENPEDVYPGFEALETFAEVQCLTAFEDYVGISPFDSELYYSWLVPTLESWQNDDDKQIICVAARTDAGFLTASIEGSAM